MISGGFNMSQFNDFLSKLAPGHHIRVTLTNGQVMEGNVVQNDAEESLLIEVKMTTMVRYRAVDSLTVVDGQAQTAPVSKQEPSAALQQTTVAAVVPAEDVSVRPVVAAKKDFDPEKLPALQPLPSKDKLYDRETNEDVLEKLVEELEPSDRSILQSTIDSLLEAYKNDNEQGMKLTASQLVQLSQSWKIEDGVAACRVAAAGLYIAGCYEAAIMMLYFGNLTREAYLTAFNASYRTNESVFYHRLAAALAVLYLLYNPSSDYYEEAATCLRESSLRCKDISGLVFLEENLEGELRLAYCYEVTKKIAEKLKISVLPNQSPKELHALMKEKFDNSQILTVILKVSQEKDAHDQKPEESKSAVITDTVDSFGTITKLNFYEDKGQITGQSGKVYDFEFGDILDVAFRKKIKSIAGKSPKTIDIPVRFDVDTAYSKSVAINIASAQAAKPTTKATADKAPSIPKPTGINPSMYVSPVSPNALFTAKQYTAALAGYKQQLEENKIEEGFCGCVQCYMKFMKDNTLSETHQAELQEMLSQYEHRLPLTMKSYSLLVQLYSKLENWQKVIEAIDKMVAGNIFKDNSQCLHFLNLKAMALRSQGRLPEAIEALAETCRFVERNRLYEKMEQIRSITYVEMADMYADLGDYQQSKYYYDMSDENAKKAELLAKIEQLRKGKTPLTQEEQPSEMPAADDTADTLLDTASADDDWPQKSKEQDAVLSAFAEAAAADSEEEAPDVNAEETPAEDSDAEESVEYTDTEAFDKLIVSDKAIIETAMSFREGQLDCLITYLAAAAEICRNVLSERPSDFDDLLMTDTITAVSELVNAAFAAHGFVQPLSCDHLMMDYLTCCAVMPAFSYTFFIAAVLRAMFAEKNLQSFEMERLMSELEKITPEAYKSKVQALASLMISFKISTGYSVDVFADYNTRNEYTQSIIRSAEECRAYIDGRVKSYESQGRLRRARELMFHDKESIIAEGLDIVCDDNIGQLTKLKRSMIDTFMRNDEMLSVENIDIKKLDRFIDTKWNIARDSILSEKKHVNRPYDNLKGGRRNNIIVMMKRAIDCICRWINASESAAVTKDAYSLSRYNDIRADMLDNLYQLVNQTQASLDDSFDWGLYSIYTTAEQLLAKLEGTYKTSSERYMFINFLRTGHILLDEDYIPDITSTFSDLSRFNIFARIKAYAEAKLPDWKYRIQQIFSDNIHNNNFRSAELIRSYGEAIGDKEIFEHPLFESLEACIKSARKRTAYFYQDFKDELELDESYGSISDAVGYKSFVARNIDAWYGSAIASCDFGFFSDLMDVYRQTISDNAEVIAVKLMKQLHDLQEDSAYDFGIYSAQQIIDHIEDRNFAIAENILNCIRRGDTKTIVDFTREPKSIFDSFLTEYDSLYRAVSDTRSPLQKSLMNYYGKRNMEAVLRKVTNNINKDVRSGIALINSWPGAYPAGEERIAKFISLLGFSDASVTRSTEFGKDDIYMVRRAKKTGKVTYPHPIPAFGSQSVEEGLRVMVLYGRYDTDRMIDKFHEINTVARHTIVILDSILNLEERRRFARKIKEEKSFARSFIVIDRVLLFYLAKHYQANTISRMLMATTMPFSYNQPYCPKPSTPLPGELFTGRTEELTRIEAYDGVNLVYGGRQLGKSSLLQMAASNIDKNANGDRAIVINIRERNYTEAARLVSQDLVMAEILPEGSECDDWDTLTMHIKKRLKDDSENRINYLLLMLDEADEFIGSCQEVRYRPITALKSLISPRFKFVLAGLHNLSKYDYEVVAANNSDIAHLESVVIRPFRRPEATELLTHALAYLGFIFNDDVINLILAKTNYFPGLIHLYAQKLIAALTNDDYAGYSETDTPYYYITDSHIRKVLSDQNFKDEINEKLRMTLEIKGKKNSPYYIISLILAYLYYETEGEEKAAFTVDEIINKAKSDEINALLQYTREQIQELMHEMWDLNILSAKGDEYMFSTEGFRELLGTKAEVNAELSTYMGGSES